MPVTWVGGLVGISQQSLVMKDCSAANLDVESLVSTKLTDGFFGFLRTGGERNIVGGLVGEIYNSFDISSCYVQGRLRVGKSDIGDSLLFGGGIAGLVRNLDGGSQASITNCIVDVLFDDTRNDSRNYSAIANIGLNATSLKPEKVTEHLYFVNETYTSQDTTGFDKVTRGDSTSNIYTEDFLYDVIGFDPMYWTIKDGKIIWKP